MNRFDSLFPAGRSGLVELKDGRFLAIVASQEGLSSTVSKNRGRTWTSPITTRDRSGNRIGGHLVGGLIRLASGGLAITYERLSHAGPSDKTRFLGLRRSDDEGETWDEETPIGLPGARAMPYHDTLTQISGGRLLQPVRVSFSDSRQRTPATCTVNGREFTIEGHAHYPEFDFSFVYYSDDEGRTWQRSEGDLFVWLDDGFRGAYACDEPVLAEAKDGRLVMFMRSTVGRIVESWSEDSGVTWSGTVANALPSSYSPSRLRRIPGTGDLHLVWNQVSYEEIRGGFRRSRLSTAISTDNGMTWMCFKTLDCCSLLDPVSRTAAIGPVSFVIARQRVGEFPPDYSVYHYPNVRYTDGTAYFLYDRDCVGERTRRRTVIRAFPVDTLYREQPWDLRLSNELPPEGEDVAPREADDIEA